MEINCEQAFKKLLSELKKDIHRYVKSLNNMKKHIRKMKNLKKKKKIQMKNKNLKKKPINFDGNEQTVNYNFVIILIIRAKNQYVYENFGNFGNWFPLDVIKLVNGSTQKSNDK